MSRKVAKAIARGDKRGEIRARFESQAFKDEHHRTDLDPAVFAGRVLGARDARAD